MFEKKDILTPKFILNPTLPEHARWLPSIAREYKLIQHFQPVKLEEIDTRTEEEVVFTHPLFHFEKPIRLSKKSGQWKPAAGFFAVFNPEELGSGVYGSVYPVIGVWKYSNSQWIFKTKSSTEKLRLVKTDVLKPVSSRDCTSKQLIKMYQEEQRIGKWVDHMGFKYPMVSHNSHPFILMRKQEGSSLGALLKKLKVNPNALSIYEKLIITINLLKSIDTQLSGVKTPQSENDKESYLVHRDIKPDNIIIDGHLNIRFIDYGFAHASTIGKRPKGTAIYTDPAVLQGHNAADKTSDLYSLYRVIGEIWGDVSSDHLKSMNDLKMRNLNGRLTGLLDGITGLSDYEKANLPEIIQQMVRYEKEDRLARETAIERFEDLLEKRVALDKAVLTELIEQRKPNKLTADELIIVLKSSRAHDFLKQFKKKTSTSNFIAKTLGLRILELDDPILAQIGEHSFTIESLIKSKEVTIEQIAKLIKIGARVKPESLRYWLTSVNTSNDELRWARMCRLLYDATENGDKILDEMKNDVSFKYLFCHTFLRNTHRSLDDQLNVRLLKQHLHIFYHHKPRIDSIETKLKLYFHKSPFVLNLLNALETYQSSSSFVLAQESQLSDIENKLQEFQVRVGKAKFETLDMMGNKRGVIQTLVKQLISIQELNDWEVALEKIENCTNDIKYLYDLELSIEWLRNLAPSEVRDQVTIEADGYYNLPKNESNKLIEQTRELCQAFHLINKIKHLKKFDSFKTELVDDEYNRIILTASLKDAQAFYKTLNSFYRFYKDCDSLFQFIEKRTEFTDECHNRVESYIKQLQALVKDIVGEKEGSQLMQQIWEKAQAMISGEKTSLYQSSYLYFFYAPNKCGNQPARFNDTKSSSVEKSFF